jgi:O-Antigen ligase
MRLIKVLRGTKLSVPRPSEVALAFRRPVRFRESTTRLLRSPAFVLLLAAATAVVPTPKVARLDGLAISSSHGILLLLFAVTALLSAGLRRRYGRRLERGRDGVRWILALATVIAEVTWGALLRGGRSLQRPAVLLAVALALTPFWPVPAPGLGWLTVGRGLLLLVAAIVVADVVRARPAPLRLGRPPVVLFGGLVALVAWTGASAVSRGCSCQGGFAGLAEWSAWTSLTALVAVVSPGHRSLLLASSAAGVALGGFLAVLEVGDFAASVADTTVGGRLGGIYGNPNFLAYAVAFAVPVLLAGTLRSGRKLRLPLVAALGGVGTVIVLTFSRGGALAALFGAFAVVVLVPRSGKWRAAIAGGAVLLLAALVSFVYPMYKHERLRVDVAGLPERPDASGWDRSAQGLVAKAGSELSNTEAGSVLKVSATERGQGVSIPIGAATPNRAYTVGFDARTAGVGARLGYALEDNYKGNGPSKSSRRIDGRWERLRVVWVPTAQSSAARFYVWWPRFTGSADLFLRKIVLTSRSRNGRIERRLISTRLLGPRPTSGRTNGEAGYIDARRAGLRLGEQAFRSSPLLGIGWERFPAYAAARAHFGQIPTHNEYVRFAAELGAPGVFLLLFIAVLAALGVRHLPRGPLRWGTLGVLVAGGVGLFFVNGLVVPPASAPLAVGVGLACSASRRQHRPPREETGGGRRQRSPGRASLQPGR